MTDNAPVTVTVVGGAGDGHEPLVSNTLAVTPGQMPNVCIQVITPLLAILVRAANTFGVTLLGLWTAQGADILPPAGFKSLAMAAAVPMLYGLLKDCITILGKLEKKYPLLSGSV